MVDLNISSCSQRVSELASNSKDWQRLLSSTFGVVQ